MSIIDNNRTNCETKKASDTTPEAFSAVNGTTDVITSNRRISLATEGLEPYVEKWLRIKTSNKNALTISEYVLDTPRIRGNSNSEQIR
jgi:hypothetical protein